MGNRKMNKKLLDICKQLQVKTQISARRRGHDSNAIVEG